MCSLLLDVGWVGVNIIATCGWVGVNIIARSGVGWYEHLFCVLATVVC